MKKPLKEWIHLLLPNDSIPTKILFRVDAGRNWGLSFGHVTRCLILAKMLKERYETDTIFLMRDYTDGVAHARMMGQKVQVLPVELCQEKERELIVGWIEQFQADALIVDVPYQNIDTSYFSDLKKKGKKVIFIDDVRYMSPDVNVVLNSSILAIRNTKKVEGREICYLLGPDYFIFDDSQIIENGQNIVKDDSSLSPIVVLITFGGSDLAGLTVKTITVLAKQYWPEVVFKVILGPGYRDYEQVKKTVQKAKNHFEILCNPPLVYPYFKKSDLTICGGGRTIYELHILGVPTLAIASISHEVPVIEAFLQKGLLVAGLSLWNEREFKRLFKNGLIGLKKIKRRNFSA